MDSIFLGEAAVPLPAPGQRWTVQRKAAVVVAVHNGQLSLQDACQLYHLSSDEFESWQRAIEQFGVGVPGLRTTRVQIYRDIRRRHRRRKRTEQT